MERESGAVWSATFKLIFTCIHVYAWTVNYSVHYNYVHITQGVGYWKQNLCAKIPKTPFYLG